jgi:transposase
MWARWSKDPRAASRAYAIAHALEGLSRAEAARLAGMERQALRDAAHQPRPGVPPSVTLLRMPPYSPELNPVERVWLYLRERHLFHGLHDRYTAVVDASSNRLGCITAS